jgi:Photosynthetic reaction centre cytochrome C subunit
MRYLTCLVVSSAVLAPALQAQGKFPPDSFTNLKVLPKTIGKQELLATMRSFALGLGVRCTYCHVGREGAPLDSIKFAVDDKRTKRAARVMMDMVKHINQEHLADVPERPEPHVVVKCETCHRGVARPRVLSDELALYLADSGLAATTRHYRDLRTRYYGSAAYDFREFPLVDVARGEARAGRIENAIGLLALSAEFFPTSGMTPAARGDVYLDKGDTASALASYREALSKDSTMMPARMRIRQLTGEGSKRP